MSDNLSADDFLHHLKEMYGGSEEQTEQDQPNLGTNTDPDLDSQISHAELKEAIFSQKNGKSCGIDNLPSELFKNSFDIVVPFSSCFLQSLVLKWRIS